MIYVINVITGKECEVAQTIKNLDNKGIKNVYNPLSIFDTPVFPSYIFIEAELSAELYHNIKDIPGVIYFLDPNSGVIPISPHEEKAVKNEPPKISLIDKAVKVVSGIYKGTKGLIKEINYPYITVKPENFYNLESAPNLRIHIKHLILIETTLEPGTKINIIKGEYAGIEGVVEQVNYPNITILAKILNKEILLDVLISEIERSENNDHRYD